MVREPASNSPPQGMVHHIEINVSNLKRSDNFWSWFLEKLGYQRFQSWDDGFSYRLHDTYLVFVQTPHRHMIPGYHRCRVGLNHIAFHATSKDQVEELTEQLRTRGNAILYEDRHPYAGGGGAYGVYFEDPDRIKIELVAAR